MLKLYIATSVHDKPEFTQLHSCFVMIQCGAATIIIPVCTFTDQYTVKMFGLLQPVLVT